VENFLHFADISDLFKKNLHNPDIKVCCWAARELKISLINLARKLEMTISGVGYDAQRGRDIALRNNFHLLECVIKFFRDVPVLLTGRLTAGK